MAVRTGTAANHVELWDELLDFLQNDSALVAAGQNWTKVWEHAEWPERELALRGPGITGGNEVLVGLCRTDEAQVAAESQIYISGMTGVIPTAERYYDHVNALPRRPLIFLDFNPMKYWFVANGRRFVVVVNISTIYQAMYGGFFLPYATPVAYPYPLFIGGTRGYSGYSSTYAPVSWRVTGADSYRHFVYPRSNTPINSWHDSSAYMLDPDGEWRGGTLDYNGSVYAVPRFVTGGRGFPRYMGSQETYPVYGPTDSFLMAGSSALGYNSVRARVTAGLNGEMPLLPVPLMAFSNSVAPSPVTYGILEGVFQVPGVGNAAENVVSVGGVDHLVVQNVQRTTRDEYWALALE